MTWRDKNGHYLQYGDYIEDLDKRHIGIIVRSSINDIPVIHIIKRFSYQKMQYENVGNNAANACYERTFLPSYNKVQKFFKGTCLPNIELIQHGERNRRVKEF